MSREPSHATSWVRWLAHCGLSPDHVARVMGWSAGDVVAACAPGCTAAPGGTCPLRPTPRSIACERRA